MFSRIVFLSSFCSLIMLNLLLSNAYATTLDVKLAEQYFAETKTVCDLDNSRLWGIALYGPILLVDPETRSIIANQADKANQLKPSGDIFIGHLPDEINIANTSLTWSGIKWAMIMTPLPNERRARLQLIVHELFHRIQDNLQATNNKNINNVNNDHLNSMIGRIWLRLEIRALESALQESGEAQKLATIDALYFRKHRQLKFPQSDIEEDNLEFNEGLAEYTGLKISARSQAALAALISYNLHNAQYKPSFSRSFAYVTGPAYGYLLDQTGLNWRKQINNSNGVVSLSALLYKHLSLNLIDDDNNIILRAKNYDGDEIISAETDLEKERQTLIAKYHEQFINGPILIFPVTDQFKYSFNPNNLFSLDNIGTVYPTLRVVDQWGILEVSDGALMSRTGNKIDRLCVSVPINYQANTIEEKGWKLVLNKGWQIVPGERKGDLIVKKSQP